MEDILVPIAFFLTIFAIVYVYWTTRTKERLALIEKGADASLFKNKASKYSSIKWGIFLIGVAIGVISGYALSTVIKEEEVAYFSMIFLFGGTGLIAAHIISARLSKNQQADN
ncbi:MAG: hypothetical protein PHH93_06155 [Prolixibacteraceae bacterium]|nr:hypothetical protein [Prolixibacteraceae bacterium]